MINRNYLFIFLIIFALGGSSCVSTKNFKNMVYLADSLTDSERIVTQDYQHILQPGDRLEIVVTALNPQAAQSFNIMSINNIANNTSNGKAVEGFASPGISGYLIDKDGNIQFPQLGNIQVKGLTTGQVADKIQNQLLQYLKQPTVLVNIANFKVNIVGEVSRPGTIVVPDGKISILEAISESGDLTVYGRRENVLIVREKNGKREFGRVDLTSNNLFNSPYFWLEQGDVVYVEMNKNKLLMSDAEQQRKFQNITLIFAGITSIAVIINLIRIL